MLVGIDKRGMPQLGICVEWLVFAGTVRRYNPPIFATLPKEKTMIHTMKLTHKTALFCLLAALLASTAVGQQPAGDDPFAPSPAARAGQPAPPAITPAQPTVQPIPVPAQTNPAPVLRVPVNPTPVNPAADGQNHGVPPGTIVVASPGRYYPWGGTKGNWVPFQYNKQWHLYRGWCQ